MRCTAFDSLAEGRPAWKTGSGYYIEVQTSCLLECLL